MKQNLDAIIAEIEELEQALSQPNVVSDQKRYRELTQKHSRLNTLRSLWEKQDKRDACLFS